jgi:hypothetical protein
MLPIIYTHSIILRGYVYAAIEIGGRLIYMWIECVFYYVCASSLYKQKDLFVFFLQYYNTTKISKIRV